MNYRVGMSGAFNQDTKREVMSFHVVRAFIETGVQPANTKTYELVVPAGVTVEVYHICGKGEVHAAGVAYLKITGSLPNASDAAKEFGSKYVGWYISASPGTMDSRATFI